MHLVKYHALGNDYLTVTPEEMPYPSPEAVRIICDRNYGAGSDGILLGPLPTSDGAFGLRIFNPDGSEAEKSGNGLRIFARRLWDDGLVAPLPADPTRSPVFAIETPGGRVLAQVFENGARVRVEMGQASFDSTRIPLAGEQREAVDEYLSIGDELLAFTAVSMGNPHCVVRGLSANAMLARRLGPVIETHEMFPNRTNVQFLEVMDRTNIRIAIWERGAGLTHASGSSSCAAAAAAHRLGLCDEHIIVHNPGGDLLVEIGPEYAMTLTGPVERVYTAKLEKRLW